MIQEHTKDKVEYEPKSNVDDAKNEKTKTSPIQKRIQKNKSFLQHRGSLNGRTDPINL